MLTEAQGRQLLEIARRSVVSYITGGVRYNAENDADFAKMDDALRQPCGAFVTLHRMGHLRGCIGLIEGVRPLWQAVEEMAVAAAVEDPRFKPVTPEETGELDIEISVLSPLTQIGSLREIEIGRHGLLIRKGRHAGLLLPQVATEHNWELEEFLRNTCYKAGINPDAWKKHKKDPEMTIYAFTAQIFKEPFRNQPRSPGVAGDNAAGLSGIND